MALGDFADLYNLAIRKAQRDPSLATDIARAKEAVNEIYMAVCEDGTFWDFLTVEGTQAMVVGQESYTFATIAASLSVPAITHVIALGTPTAANPFSYLGWDDYNAVKAINPALGNGIPNLWTIVGDATVSVWPKPNATTALRVLALRQAAELTNDTDNALIPLQLRRKLIANGAAAALLRQEGGVEAQQEASLLDKEFDEAYAMLKAGHVLPGQIQQPTPEAVQLPAGLQPTANTFLDAVHRVCYMTGLRPWMPYDVTRVKEAINAVYLRICGSGDDWDFLEKEGNLTLTANTSDYAFSAIATALGVSSTGVNEILTVVNDTTGSTPLIPYPYNELERRVESTKTSLAAAGEPALFTIFGDGAGDRTFRFFPKPDIAYVMRFLVRLKVVRLVNDTDVFLIPADWLMPVIVPAAATLILRQPGNDKTWSERIAISDRYEQQAKDAFAGMREARAAARAPLAMAIGASYPLSDPSFSSDGWGTL